MSPWQVDRLDLGGYLERLGLPARPPSIDALADLHEAHLRTFTFDNIDVLLDQHPGVSLEAVQGKFVDRGRGGYCFEHGTILAAVLDRLGYVVRRQLARVGDPASPSPSAQTHLVVSVELEGQRLLCDPGFGMSVLRPIPMIDGAEDDYPTGWRHRITLGPRGWTLSRLSQDGWEAGHTTSDREVYPADIVVGHHFTSTHPSSHFTHRLRLGKHLPGRHVMLTDDTVTIRMPGRPTEHRGLATSELGEWLTTLEVPLSADERQRLLARVAEISGGT